MQGLQIANAVKLSHGRLVREATALRHATSITLGQAGDKTAPGSILMTSTMKEDDVLTRRALGARTPATEGKAPQAAALAAKSKRGGYRPRLLFVGDQGLPGASSSTLPTPHLQRQLKGAQNYSVRRLMTWAACSRRVARRILLLFGAACSATGHRQARQISPSAGGRWRPC